MLYYADNEVFKTTIINFLFSGLRHSIYLCILIFSFLLYSFEIVTVYKMSSETFLIGILRVKVLSLMPHTASLLLTEVLTEHKNIIRIWITQRRALN